MTEESEVRAFSTAKLAEMLSVGQRHIQKMVAEGKIRAVWIGGALRIPRDEIDKLLRSGTDPLDGEPSRASLDSARRVEP